MPRPLTIASVIDKNKIASDTAWIVLVKVDVKDRDGNHIEYLTFCQNNENIIYRDEEYVAADFSIDHTVNANEEPSLTFSAFDPTGVIRDRMEEYAGGVGFDVTIFVVNTGNLTGQPEIEETFSVVGSGATDYNVTFTLGVESILKYSFPPRRQYRDRCMFVYGGTRCGYSGAMPSCDYTLDGSNGCRAHDNIARFGGFRSLQNGLV